MLMKWAVSPSQSPQLSSNHLLSEATCSPFSLCLSLLSVTFAVNLNRSLNIFFSAFCSPAIPSLFFSLYSFLFNSIFLHLSLLNMSVRQGRSCSDRQEQRRKKTGWAGRQGDNLLLSLTLYVLRAFSATGNMSQRALPSHRQLLPFTQHKRQALIQFKTFSTLFSIKRFLERIFQSTQLILMDVTAPPPPPTPYTSSTGITAVSSCHLQVKQISF